MFPSLRECEEKSVLPQKFTMIIGSCQSDLSLFMKSVFSLLLRSDDVLEHFIVSINGPDSRLGDTSLQDQKQQFLEELRLLTWRGKAMPLTVIRVWSRIGHAQSLEMAIPWVHTEYYGIMHDDVIILKNWTSQALEDFKNPNLVLDSVPPLLSVALHGATYNGFAKLGLPNLNTQFVLCRKSLMAELGARWCGHHIEFPVDWNKLRKNNFEESYKDFERFANSGSDCNFNVDTIMSQVMSQDFRYISLDIGAWVFRAMFERNLAFKLLPEELIYHMKAQSWGRKRPIDPKIDLELESELREYPEYWRLYEKYDKGA